MSEYNRYVTATHSFRDKYFGLPGDMTNATQFWGTQDATLATCVVTASTDRRTCNGNGDGLLRGGAYPVASNHYESYRAWQHLANAGLVEGTFTGTQASAAEWHTVVGSNVPRSKLTQAGWWYYGTGAQVSAGPYFDGDYGNVLYFGGQVTNSWNYAPVLKPEESWNIDTKVDDGRPGYGKVRPLKSSSPFCPTTTDASTATYALNNTGLTCILMFTIG